MSGERKDKPFDLGFFVPLGREGGVTASDIVALALSVAWLCIAGAVFAFVGRDAGAPGAAPLGHILVLLAVVTPVALIWVGAAATKSARIMRQEAARLEAAIDALRQSHIQQQQNAGVDVRPALEKKLEELARAQRQTESALATFASTRAREPEPAAPPPAAPRAGAEPEAQASLALGAPAEALRPPLETHELLRALNFPETTGDREGFRALRRALEDRMAAKLVRSAQDVLTLLSQDGIYMDDLKPDRARPELWRRFAQGERGPAVAALGGVRDRSCLALTAARMKQDPIFRDVAHHFLRQFDRLMVEFEQTASDQEISDLAETRTSRAFMLLGRVTGMFG
ncbi:hypothetical protein SAMN05444722_2347 [Rhodovulum sp. ES.010]|uniref:hypothetical protein n=1 Tax=Rhodovulum sp. ES.010 TaxID=1882821 RepID=UPI00092BA0DC|nr:hypothetical protein [Rhodovulum sp. ES.010]SIO46689.1 hypothetical protein SAMN05444722_2347 [Rhodovulum sp. ES.010]